MANNKRAPAETLFFLIGELAKESPDDRTRIIDSLITWFDIAAMLTSFGAVVTERSDDRDR